MLGVAAEHGFEPRCVAFDSWYSSLENFKAVRGLGWWFLTQLKTNRKVDVARAGTCAVSEAASTESGTLAHLPGFGAIRIFKVVSRVGNMEYWATNDLAMDELTRLAVADQSWSIETYHRVLKQCCGVERAQVRAARRNATTLGCRSGRSFDWSITSSPRASVVTRPRPESYEDPFERTSLVPCTG